MAARDGAEPCCHGNIQVRAFWVCWGEKTLRYVCLATFLYISVCPCVCVPYCVMSQSCHDVCQCLRNATHVASRLMPALPCSTPLQPHLVLADHASVTTVTSQTVAKVTTRCIEVAGIKTMHFTP